MCFHYVSSSSKKTHFLILETFKFLWTEVCLTLLCLNMVIWLFLDALKTLRNRRNLKIEKRLYITVCMCVRERERVCVYVCMYVCMQVHRHPPTHTHRLPDRHIYMRVCVWVCGCVGVCGGVRARERVYVWMYVYMQVYRHTHTHTHKQTDRQIHTRKYIAFF